MKNLKEWQKVFLGVTTIIILLVATDRIAGYLSQSLYNNSKYGIFGRQIYCLHESKEDMLIIGSSKASHHYVPTIFQDSLNLSCYNCGSEGMCIYYHYGILASYIERGEIPKLVIYDVMDLDAEKYAGPTFNLDAALDRFAPHYNEYESIDSLFRLKGWKENIKLLSKCYRYNSKLVQSIKCNFILSKEDNGYEAVIGNLADTSSFQVREFVDMPIDSNKLEYVRKLIRLSKKYEFPLVMIQSPKYYSIESNGIDTIKKIATQENIPFLDYVNEESLMKKEYFRDCLHLNDNGAHIWSEFMPTNLNNYIKNEKEDSLYRRI